MHRYSLLPLACFLLAGLLLVAAPTADAQEDDGPVVYMTQHKIHPSKVDSLIALTSKYDIPWHNFVAENVEGYRRYFMRHDTGNEYNFLIATMYPNWDMIDSMPFEDLWPKFVASQGMTMEEAEADEMGVAEAFDWAYEDAQHMDQIWRPVSSTGQRLTPEMLGDAVIYMEQHKIKQSRLDSLATLDSGAVVWHNYIADNRPGYEWHTFRHDTGNEYNYMVVTTVPDWDMLRGDEMQRGTLWRQFLAERGMTQQEWDERPNAGARDWVTEGSQHIDQIWRPILPASMDGDM